MKARQIMSEYYYKHSAFNGILYHSTNAKLQKFSLKKASGGIYFHPYDGPMWGKNVYRAHVKLNNAMVTDDRRTVQHMDAHRRSQLEHHGYDGAIYEVDGKIEEVVVFNPENIKLLSK